MLGAVNPSTGALPFQSLRVADLGNVNVNLYNLQDSCRVIREVYQNVLEAGCIPLTLGNGCRQGQVWLFHGRLGRVVVQYGPMGSSSPGEAAGKIDTEGE